MCEAILQKWLDEIMAFLKSWKKTVSAKLGAEVGRKTVVTFYKGMQLIKHIRLHLHS